MGWHGIVSSKNEGLTKSQIKRKSFPYRTAYFRANPGVFGTFWFCSQCGKPLLKSQVEVDHIVPLGSIGQNNLRNLTACCHDCNHSKSDALKAHYVFFGKTHQLLERTLLRSSNPVVETAMLAVMFAIYPIRFAIFKMGLPLSKLIGKAAVKGTTSVGSKAVKTARRGFKLPFKSVKNVAKVAMVVLLAAGLYYLSKLGVLNAVFG